jgi:hypothetical protein
MAAAHFFRSAWFSGDSQKYFLALRPYETVFLYVWSGLGLVAMGFFRIWRIRTRIALLHSRIPAATLEAAEGESQAHPTGVAGNWAGPWGLAVMAAVLLGTSAVRSEISPFALVSTLGLALAVLCDRPDKFPKPATLLLRLLGAAAVLPTLLWAGSPLSMDAARVYALSISRISVEAIAFTASISVLVAGLVSSFRLPPPASRGKMALVALAEITIVAIFITVGMLIPRYKDETLPARAVIREYLGSEARITIDATRPLGNLALMPDGVQPAIQEVPAGLISRTRSEVVRLGLKVPTTWADISQATVSTEKGEKATTVSGTLMAAFRERPAFFQLTLQDVALTKNSTTAFILEDLAGLIGGAGESPDINVEPRVGYAVIVTWWMPVEASLTRDFTLTIVPTSSRVDVTGRALYLGRSYLGLVPSAANTTFTMVTSVAGLTTYR